MKKNSIIESLIKEHPEVKNFKKGFPNIGKREDGCDFGIAVKNIEQAWYYYDIDLYGVETNNKIIKLGNGNPLKYKSFPSATKFLKKQLKKNLFEYSAAAGDEQHRQIISEYLIKEGYPNYLNYNNIIITDSTTAGFYLILKAIFRPYDVIIMTAPNYGLFTFMPERMNISVELIELEAIDNYIINPNKLRKRIIEINNKLKKKYGVSLGYIPKVRAFFNMNPHNPLGTVLSARNIKVLTNLGKVCQENDVFIIDDLVYRDLTYNRSFLAKPVGTLEKYFDTTISLFGLSKSYGLAKARAGFIVANEVVIRLLRDNLFYIMDSSSILQSSLLAGTYNPSKTRDRSYKRYFKKLIPKYQLKCYLAIAMFDGVETIKDTAYYNQVLKMLKKKIKNKNLLRIALEGVPTAKTVITPESGFFLLIDFTELKNYDIIKNERDLLNFLYENCGTKFLIGQSFSWPNSEEIIARITYSLNDNSLIDAILKINLAIREVTNETNRSNYSCKTNIRRSR